MEKVSLLETFRVPDWIVGAVCHIEVLKGISQRSMHEYYIRRFSVCMCECKPHTRVDIMPRPHARPIALNLSQASFQSNKYSTFMRVCTSVTYTRAYTWDGPMWELDIILRPHARTRSFNLSQGVCQKANYITCVCVNDCAPHMRLEIILRSTVTTCADSLCGRAP